MTAGFDLGKAAVFSSDKLELAVEELQRMPVSRLSTAGISGGNWETGPWTATGAEFPGDPGQ